MRIPSGDLAPARRRRGRGGYGRSRRGRALPVVLVVVLVAAVAGGAFLLRRDDGQAPDQVAQQSASPCPSASATKPAPAPSRAPVVVALPAPAQVPVRLLNGTPRDGLAKTVGDMLAARGFPVLSTGNAPTPLPGATRVSYGPGGDRGARVAAAWIVGAQVVGNPRQARGSVDVVLGTSFQRLRTPAEAAGALRGPVVAAPATKAPAPSATPTCR